jgi:hypothetical protein
MAIQIGKDINDTYDNTKLTLNSRLCGANSGDDDSFSGDGNKLGELLGESILQNKLFDSDDIEITLDEDENSIAVLTDTNVNAASYGSASAVANFAVDAKGRLTSAGNIIIRPQSATRQVSSGTITIDTSGAPNNDIDGTIRLTSDDTDAMCELPSNATTSFPIGAYVDFVVTGARSSITFTAGSGATVNGVTKVYSGGALRFKKVDTNVWFGEINIPYAQGVHNTNLTGPWASPISTDIEYTLIGNRVDLTFTQAGNTSTILSNITSSTALPDFLRPSAIRFFGIYVLNNSVNLLSVARVDTDGIFTFYGMPDQTRFPASGTASLLSWEGGYQL